MSAGLTPNSGQSGPRSPSLTHHAKKGSRLPTFRDTSHYTQRCPTCLGRPNKTGDGTGAVPFHPAGVTWQPWGAPPVRGLFPATTPPSHCFTPGDLLGLWGPFSLHLRSGVFVGLQLPLQGPVC